MNLIDWIIPHICTVVSNVMTRSREKTDVPSRLLFMVNAADLGQDIVCNIARFRVILPWPRAINLGREW